MKRPASALVLIALAVAGTAADTAPDAAAGAAGTADGTQPGDDITVTLVTGDRVVIPGGDLDQAHVEPAEGRADISFHISSAGDHLEVVPADASPQLASRTLDRRLFDVSVLIESGYDDANSDAIPLLASAPAAPAAAGTAIRHDRDAQFVSLRAVATDEGGNTVEQTIIRAYELAQR